MQHLYTTINETTRMSNHNGKVDPDAPQLPGRLKIFIEMYKISP